MNDERFTTMMRSAFARFTFPGMIVGAALASGCSPSEAPPAVSPASAGPGATAAVAPPSHPHPSVDPGLVAATTGGKPEVIENVVKVSFPRDVPVEIDRWTSVPPFMGLTSWAGFAPGEKPGVDAMVMGDLVVFEDEVSPVLSAALNNGLEVTALHNHFAFEKPRVLFMHIGGEGTVEKLGKGVRAALDAQKAVRQKSPQPSELSGAPALPVPSHIDGAKLDAVFGLKGTAKDGMYKAVMGRTTRAACGCTVGKALGVNTWAAFAGSDDNAVVDGDFAVAETELQPVLKALRAGGINILAIHSHMTGESPRILFLHYWGRASSADLAKTIKRALDLTAWEGQAQTT